MSDTKIEQQYEPLSDKEGRRGAGIAPRKDPTYVRVGRHVASID
ncbi:MAG TPA: hypothetical protein V6D19_00200 [Stenomitos sp.]